MNLFTHNSFKTLKLMPGNLFLKEKVVDWKAFSLFPRNFVLLQHFFYHIKLRMKRYRFRDRAATLVSNYNKHSILKAILVWVFAQPSKKHFFLVLVRSRDERKALRGNSGISGKFTCVRTQAYFASIKNVSGSDISPNCRNTRLIRQKMDIYW